ncbi:mediator of RNA polymerase II transcription subunit 4 isoform X1 [Dunckerocampus dactyliophorus]|uniref:mediator of RNA polymerase II transcription subunit 4 isoform X1 n=1 Tax=Dunckerocampus dactyliophorus TaxID=161453 RepID=UPI002405FEC8|nr:mediator of RNA polymerase II transcription subunit 4 isoform X1 [Dunckerocampus dactyliophorus]
MVSINVIQDIEFTNPLVSNVVSVVFSSSGEVRKWVEQNGGHRDGEINKRASLVRFGRFGGFITILELLVQRDREFQELMEVAQQQGKVHQEMQLLEKEVEKRDSDIQQLQKQLKEAEHILATAVYQAKEKLKSIERARKGSISSEEIIKYAHRISASNAVCAPLNWVPGDPRRPYPTDLEMRSGMLGHMANLPTNGVNGHLPGDALAAGRLPDVLTPHYPWPSSDLSVGMLPPHHGNDFGVEPPGHNKENEDDVEAMSTDSSSSSSDSD